MEISEELIENILSEQEVVALAMTSPDGKPHNTPVWITNDGTTLYVLTRSNRKKVLIARTTKECMIALQWASIRGTISVIDSDNDRFEFIRNLMDKRYTKAPGYWEYKKRWDVALMITPYKIYRQ